MTSQSSTKPDLNCSGDFTGTGRRRPTFFPTCQAPHEGFGYWKVGSAAMKRNKPDQKADRACEIWIEAGITRLTRNRRAVAGRFHHE